MPKIHALLVGIDHYLLPGIDLRGCLNDVDLAERLLRDRVAPERLRIEKLCDAQATRARVIEGFRRHLGGLGAGDVGLFWYSGHGSTGPLPAEIWYAESAGACQTMVCHDSRAGAPDLYDKELAVLVGEVVATGAQLVTVMDSCHSRSAMRDLPVAGLTPRLAPALAGPPALRELLPELVAGASDPARPVPGRQLAGHVALSACDEWELANELPFADGWHGAFSEALAHALARLGPDATYRQALSHARCRVEGRLSRQTPTLEAVGDLADREFLGRALRPRPARVTMRRPRRHWEVDAGAVHGVATGARFGVHDTAPLREVRVVRVHTDHSIVEPIGWSPEPERQYEMVLTDVALPPVAVSIRTAPDVAARLARSIQTAGPTGGPSPHIRIIAPADAPAAGLRLAVRPAADHRTLQVTSIDGEPLAPPVPADEHGLEQTVRDLEHIARWLQVRNLQSASPALEEAVRIELVPAPSDGMRPAHDRPPVDDLTFAYTRTDAGWEPPSVFVRLRNTSDRKLYCVLLNLTDRYRMHPHLFPGEYVAGQWVAEAGNGAPIVLTLPPDRPVEPGASVVDWLVLLVAEEPFSSDPFWLPRLRELPRPATRGGRGGITGVLDRLGLLAVQRDLEPAAPVASDWAVKVVEITTRVP